MKVRFNRASGLIRVQVRLTGPTGAAVHQFALDTGAARTMVAPEVLESIGYELHGAGDWIQIATVSQHEQARLVMVRGIRSLGHERADIPVVCHGLPSEVMLHGLLGLDFLRGSSLNIDFANGTIELNRGGL